jgi:DNA-binding GntR family transcriptional regulator
MSNTVRKLTVTKRAQTIALPQTALQERDPAHPMATHIITSLKTAICDFTLKPGQIISEAEVGHVFSASRTPVREAFSELRAQGLVVTLPNRGTFVTKLSVAQIKGAQFVREALETAIAARLCETDLPPAARDLMTQNLAAQRHAVDTADVAAFHALDDQFHLTLGTTLDLPRIDAVLDREKAWLDRLRVLSLNDDDHPETLLADHTAIFAAICAQDTEAATYAVQTHLRRVLATLSDLVSTHHEYFDDT